MHQAKEKRNICLPRTIETYLKTRILNKDLNIHKTTKIYKVHIHCKWIIQIK